MWTKIFSSSFFVSTEILIYSRDAIILFNPIFPRRSYYKIFIFSGLLCSDNDRPVINPVSILSRIRERLSSSPSSGKIYLELEASIGGNNCEKIYFLFLVLALCTQSEKVFFGSIFWFFSWLHPFLFLFYPKHHHENIHPFFQFSFYLIKSIEKREKYVRNLN